MLKRKMLRTIKLYKAQFLSMILMVFLGVAVFVGITSEWYGMRVEVDKFYKEYNLADTWVYSDNFTREELNQVLELNCVKNAERRLMVDTKLADSEKTIRLHFIEKGEISRSFLSQGDKFNIDSDGIWLFDEFAYKNNLNVNDEISLKYNRFTFKKRILGLIKNPEYVYSTEDDTVMISDAGNFGYAFLSYKAYPLSNIEYNQLLITKNEVSSKVLETKIRTSLLNKAMIFVAQEDHKSVQMFEEEIESNKIMGGIFPVIFLLIAILSMITTMTRITSNEKFQIGVLKALGFSKKKITLHYTSYGLLVGLIGSVLGIIIGPLTLGRIFLSFQKSIYYLPTWKTHIALVNYLVVLMMVLLLVLVSYLACRKNLKGSASESLRPLPRKIKSTLGLEKTRLWNKLSFNIKWNLRDLFRNKIRSLMSILGVGGCMMLMICAFSLNDSMKDISKWMYEDLHHYHTKINITENAPNEEINKLRTLVNGEVISNNLIELKLSSTYEIKTLDIYDVHHLIHFEDIERNRIVLEGKGIYISHKLSKSLNIEQGDTITWRLLGASDFIDSEIVGIVRTPVGQGFIMNGEYAASVNVNYQITSIFTTETEIDESLNIISNIQSKSDLKNSLDTILETLQVIIYIMIIGALILGLVVLYNLGVISFTERFRELSTLKVLGFQDKQINQLIISQNIWLTIIGIIIGLPLGKMLVKIIFELTPENLDYRISISLLSYIICILGTLTVSIIVNLMLFKKTSQIDMVSSLKISE